MIEFLKTNTGFILFIIKLFLVIYAILSSIGIARRIIRHVNKNTLKKSIGYLIYNILGSIIFLVALFVLFYVTDMLLAYGTI